jgi:hypothetical protein
MVYTDLSAGVDDANVAYRSIGVTRYRHRVVSRAVITQNDLPRAPGLLFE